MVWCILFALIILLDVIRICLKSTCDNLNELNVVQKSTYLCIQGLTICTARSRVKVEERMNAAKHPVFMGY